MQLYTSGCMFARYTSLTQREICWSSSVTMRASDKRSVAYNKCRRLTKRALDAGDSARFTSIFLASSFFCSQTESTPAPAPLTQTVGQNPLHNKVKNPKYIPCAILNLSAKLWYASKEPFFLGIMPSAKRPAWNWKQMD